MGRRSTEDKKCPECGDKMVQISQNIGGFAGHLFVHSTPQGYKCQNKKCGYKEPCASSEPEDVTIGDRGGRT